ncbi:MAG: hypothetical protein Q8N47_11315 [Bryobacterales bacterium]|nr:hypothetical protein [Bryobacterales bacterium]
MSGPSRREALLGAAAVSAVRAVAAPDALPTVKLGPHTVSRLIVGGNPVSGNSHTSDGLGREMRDYFTAENVKKMLRNCEQAGINTWQSRGDKHIQRLLTEYRGDGGRIQWIAQTASELADIPRHIRDLASMKPVGIYHHGSQTDKFWAAGKIEQAREMCKVMRDAGVQVGLGTHIPEVIDYVESKAWDVDFYMTCLYNISRTKEEQEKLAGRKVDDQLFWHPDREKMLARVRQTTKPCLIFKVYGASRNCGSPEKMLDALRLAAKYAKPQDAIVIGMFPKHSEQVNQNCRLVMQALGESAAT